MSDRCRRNQVLLAHVEHEWTNQRTAVERSRKESSLPRADAGHSSGAAGDPRDPQQWRLVFRPTGATLSDAAQRHDPRPAKYAAQLYNS